MHRRIAALVLACFYAGLVNLQAQEFKLFDRTVQVHGFASQGFVYTDTNNWLTMHSNEGSAAFTDFGVNASTSINDQLRIGAQLYDRNLGELGSYHVSLDWALADYRFKSWLGLRGGKVKTTLGLYNDTQDLDFLRTFALLPQSIYPTDVRDDAIAHVGGDIYGNVQLKNGLGDLSYTAYVGHRDDSAYSGHAYTLSSYHAYLSSGLQYGADLRWNTPLKGLLVGASRLNEEIVGTNKFMDPSNPGTIVPSREVSKADWNDQFYGQCIVGKLGIDAEYKRFVHDGIVNRGAFETVTDVRGWYVAATYRILKRLAVGSYYSRYSVTSEASGPLDDVVPDQRDSSLPGNHIYDKVICARVDLKRFWNLKVEAHFMNGYGVNTYPNGFYPQQNAQGFAANTNALVVKTGINF